MSALFSHSVPFRLLLSPPSRRVCGVYCVQYQSITPRVWDTKNQTGRDSVWAGAGARAGRAAVSAAEAGAADRGLGAVGEGKGGEGRGGSGGNNARSNKHTKGLCALRPIGAHSRMRLAGAITG